MPNTGGTITNTGAGTPTFRASLNNASQTFAGVIGSLDTNNRSINFQRSGGYTFTLTSPSNYTGTSVFDGGLTILKDSGSILSTSSIALRRTELQLDNTGLSDIARLPANVAITMDGADLLYLGAAGNASAQSVGSITLNSGASNIMATVANAGGASLTIGTLNRVAGQGIVNFTNTITGAGTTSGLAGALGNPGSLNAHIIINNLNTTGTPAATTTTPFIGGWALWGYNDFAGYDTTNGVVVATYTSSATLPASNAATNLKLTAAGTVTLPAGALTSYNSINLNAASGNVAFNTATDTLNLVSGGLLADLGAHSLGTAAVRGNITVGGATGTAVGNFELFIHSVSQPAIINSNIIDDAVSSHLSVYLDNGAYRNPAAGTTGSITLTGVNTYTGTTYVGGSSNGNTAVGAGAGQFNVALSGTANVPTIPGDLVITGGNDSNASFVTLNAAGQIASTSNVTVNGLATLALNGSNDTIASLTFNDNGGSFNYLGPSVTTGAGTLTVNGAITSSNVDNYYVAAPLISGLLSLPSGVYTIQADTPTGSPAQISLSITAAISGAGGITKTGGGALTLSGGNSYTGNTIVNAGTLNVSSTTALGAAANSLNVNNPNTGAGTAVIVNINNAVTIGSLASTIANPSSGTNSATINLVGVALTDNQVGNTSFTGVLAGTGGFTMGASSAGTLTLTGTNTYTGVLTLSGGTLNAVTAGINGSNTTSGIVFSGGTLQAATGGITTGKAVTMTGTGTFDTNGNDSILSGLITYTSNLTKTGTGTLTISGASNTGAGGLTISNGTVMSGNTAVNLIGTGSVFFANNANVPTLDLNGNNLTIAPLSGAGTNGVVTNNNTGTSTLTIGAAGSQIFAGTIKDGATGKMALTVNSAAATQFLTGVNTYTGLTTLTAGILNINSNVALGSTSGTIAPLTLTGGTLQYAVGATNTDISGRTVTLGAGGGIIDTNGNNVTFANPLTLGTGTITKTGAGTLFLGGTNSYTGLTIVRNGTLNLQSGVSLTATVGLDVGGAAAPGAVMAVNGGAVTVGASGIGIGEAQTSNPNSTGTLYLSAGSITAANTNTIGWNTTGGTAASGTFYQTGGSYTQSGGDFYVGVKGAGSGVPVGVYNISGGTFTGASAKTLFVAAGGGSTGGAVGTLNIDGTAAVTVPTNGAFNTSTTPGTATINLGGGTLTTPAWSSVASTTLNMFNGGKLQANVASATWLGSTGAVNLYAGAGGGVIDTNGLAMTITQAFANPTGSGVTSFNVNAADSTTVFASPPSLTFNGGTGTNATGYATLDSSGHIASFIITNPGSYSIAPTSVTIAGSTESLTPVVASNSTGGLTKVGAGTLTLTTSSTYVGGTTVNAGTLTINTGVALGGATNSLTVNNPNSGAGTAVVLNLNSAQTIASLAGTVANPSSGTNSATINLTGAATILTVNQTGNTSYASVLAGTGGLTMGASGTGALTLSGANSYTGGTILNGGNLVLGSSNVITAGAIVSGPVGTAALTLSGGKLSDNGGASVLANAVNINAGTSSFGGTGSLTLDGSGVTTPTVVTLSGTPTLNVTNTTIFASAVTGTGFTKTGAGTLELRNAANSFAGGISVTGGTLRLNNAGNNVTGANAISVSAGSTLVSTSLVNGAVTIGNGTTSGVLDPHLNSTSFGTMTIANALTLNTGSVLDFNYGSGSTDQINLTGGSGILTLNGTSTLNLVQNGGLSDGIFQLITSPSAALGSGAINLGTVPTFGHFQLMNVVSGQTYNPTFGSSFTATSSGIDLIVAATHDTWTGAVDNTWQVNSPITGVGNWTSDSGPQGNVFLNGDAVTFDDNGANRNITVAAGGVQPFSVTVNNSNGIDYTIGGGAIAGTGGIVKTNTGTLTLTGANTFTGPVVIKQGILTANSIADSGTSALGFGTSLVLGDTTNNTAGTLQYTGATATTGRALTVAGQGGTIDTGTNNITFSGASTGSGTITKMGSGTLALSSAANTYTGSLAVQNGTLSTASFGAGTAGTTLTIGSAGNSATYQYTGASAVENRAVATAGTSATINVTSAATTLTLGGNISGATALTVSGSGTLSVAGNNSQAGLKISSGATVNANVTGANTILGGGAVTLSGGTLNVVGSNINPVGLSASLFLPNAGSPNLAATMLTFLASSSAAMPKTLNQDLTFTDNPASTFFNAPIIANTAGNNFNFSDLYTGFFTPTVTGVHTFSLTVDDNADFWIDLNRNGVFDAGEDVVTKHGSGTLSNTTTLTAGLSYKIAITHEDTGGTSIMTAQFSEPAGGTITSLTNINPSTQGTRWTTGVGTVGFSTTDVVLTTDSVLNVSSAASFRTLIPTAGQTLNLTSGAVRFAGTDLSTTNPLKVNVSSGASLALARWAMPAAQASSPSPRPGWDKSPLTTPPSPARWPAAAPTTSTAPALFSPHRPPPPPPFVE